MSNSAPLTLRQELRDMREPLIQAMLRATVPLPGQETEERRQFVAGYLDLVTHAAEGDLAPRDAYLETVVPGIKQAGLKFEYVLAEMGAVAMAIAANVRPEHLAWHVTFTRDYMMLLIQEWHRG